MNDRHTGTHQMNWRLTTKVLGTSLLLRDEVSTTTFLIYSITEISRIGVRTVYDSGGIYNRQNDLSWKLGVQLRDMR